MLNLNEKFHFIPPSFSIETHLINIGLLNFQSKKWIKERGKRKNLMQMKLLKI